jgi:Rad3-related DNA helicase
MSDFISIKITDTVIKKLRFDNENEIISKLKNVSSIDDYIQFLEYFRGEIILTIAKTNNNMNTNPKIAKNTKRDLKLSKILDYVNDDVKSIQVMSDLKQYETKIEVFLKEYNDDRDNWVLEKIYNEKTRQYELSLEPIWSYKYLNKYVWDNYDMVILMSGTILSKKIFSELNGLDLKKCVYYSIPSPFPMENRQIYYMPLGKMSYSKKEETFVNYKNFLDKILFKYKDYKGIIHTNSFELSTWIKNDIKNNRLLFHDSVNKTEMLKKHFDSEEPTVLISPSISTGVSFDGDKSRFQVIAKIPYPSLASQKNKLRQKNNPEWYAWKTCAILQQMCGRSIRSKTDFADTIIIDGSFGDIIKYSSEYLPLWFQESIKRINVKL